MSEMIERDYSNFVRFPPLKLIPESLTGVEKSVLGNLMLVCRPKVIVETGVYEAHSTEFMCQFMEHNQITGSVYGFDLPNVVSALRDTNEAVKHYEAQGSLHLIPGRLPHALDEWLKSTHEPIDLALIDAAHDYRSVLLELQLIWPRLANNGFIVCHDYANRNPGVQYAVDYFVRTHHTRMLPLVTSLDAQTQEYESAIAILCHPQHKYKFWQWAYHWSLKFRADLLTVTIIRNLWMRIRPFIKGELDEPPWWTQND